MKKMIIVLCKVVLCLVVVVCGYVGYVYIAYTRVADNVSVSGVDVATSFLSVGKEYSILTYNVGYGSYPADYTFFMEGGKESIARSKEDVVNNISGSIGLVKEYMPDIILFQEVDIKGTRSYDVNEYTMLRESFSSYSSFYSQNYNSPYLLYPLNKPIGKNVSSLAVFSKFKIQSTVRRSLPVSSSFSKFFDLDRCYTVSEMKVQNGKSLYLYNVHLTAYGGSEEIRIKQMTMLAIDMKEKITSGGYVICGGDFNSDVLTNSFARLNKGRQIPEWSKPLLTELLPKGITVCTNYKEKELIPTSRSLSMGYTKGKSEVMVIDGFLVSDNIQKVSIQNIDNGFKYSDHNPVLMKFELK